MIDPWRKRVEIGDCVLYLGDCLEILPALDAVDMVFTDPPYGHNNNNGDLIHQREAALGRLPSGATPPVGRPIANDGPEANELFRLTLRLMEAKLRRGGCCCCCCCGGGGGPDPQFARWSLWMDEVFNFKQMVVWDKGPMGMGWHYRRSYETVLVGTKRGGPCKWYDTTKRIENIIRPDAVGKIIPQADEHPTVKPVALAEHFVRLHSTDADIILDPFMGSGTTLVACANLGRRGIGIEIEERYFDIACKRVKAAYAQPRLPLEEPKQSKQEELPYEA